MTVIKLQILLTKYDGIGVLQCVLVNIITVL